MELEVQAIPECSKLRNGFLGIRVRLSCCELVLIAGTCLVHSLWGPELHSDNLWPFLPQL